MESKRRYPPSDQEHHSPICRVGRQWHRDRICPCDGAWSRHTLPHPRPFVLGLGIFRLDHRQLGGRHLPLLFLNLLGGMDRDVELQCISSDAQLRACHTKSNEENVELTLLQDVGEIWHLSCDGYFSWRGPKGLLDFCPNFGLDILMFAEKSARWYVSIYDGYPSEEVTHNVHESRHAVVSLPASNKCIK